MICGDDDFLVEQAARQLVDRLVPPDARALGIEVYDGRVGNVDEMTAVLRRTVEAVETPGFFGAGKLVWLREPAILAPKRRGRKDEGDDDEPDAADGRDPDERRNSAESLLETLTARIASGLPEGVTLLVTALKVGRTSAFFKACQAAGEVQDFAGSGKPWEVQKAAVAHLAAWLPRLGLQMADEVRTRYVAQVGTDSRRIASELEKLRAYKGEDPVVSSADVDAVVSPGADADVWSLSDAFGQRDIKATAETLHRLLHQGESPIALVTMLESRLRDLIGLRAALDGKLLTLGGSEQWPRVAWKELPQAFEIWARSGKRDIRASSPTQIGKLTSQASRWSLRELRWARHRVVGLRWALVSSSVPPEFLLDPVLLGLLRRPAAPAAAKPASAATTRKTA